MSKSYKKQGLVNEAKYYVLDALSGAKFKILITLVVMLVCLVIGIILGVKYNANNTINVLKDFGVVSFIGNGVTSSFFSRLLSILFILLILFACSFSKFLLPLAVVILGLRAYLLGFNLCLLFLGFGVPGMFLAIFIFLPFHLIVLALLCLYFFLLPKARCGKKGSVIKLTLIFFAIIFVLCIIETILLSIFNASVIIVI